MGPGLSSNDWGTFGSSISVQEQRSTEEPHAVKVAFSGYSQSFGKALVLKKPFVIPFCNILFAKK